MNPKLGFDGSSNVLS